ncbi:TetR/AcrR family transcriptional regulator [Streptomyces globisporus]|uniref:TetR/AcrR family transcriptional regulator n=1 Tax=Streptomyces globisporus TaxID=1908 RepID=UPI00386F2248|nr:TetR/AcrR family transcriptional regulator [Streptomyces globisporus]
METREKILKAAAEMIAEDVAAKLSVRAVAARAGVSTGSLRFHFPTQRALQDSLLARIYEHLLPRDPIRDLSLAPRERLLNCLRQVLALLGTNEDARTAWGATYRTFIEPEPTETVRAAYLGLKREAERRVEHWLNVLAEEGALSPGDHARNVRFLLTMLNGLSLERALPTGESVLVAETETLNAAVDHVLSTSPTSPAGPAPPWTEPPPPHRPPVVFSQSRNGTAGLPPRPSTPEKCRLQRNAVLVAGDQ